MKIASKISAAALVIAAALGLTSCESKKTLNVFTWTYYTPTEVVKAFEQEYNCQVIVTEYDSNETMFNKLINGGSKSFDIVVPSQDYASIMIAKDMVQPINQELFTNKSKINPKVLEKAIYDSEMKYFVPYYFGAAGISVNKTKVPAGSYERTWNIFADPQFKGHSSMMNDYREVIGDSLKYLGYSVNTKDETELNKAVDHISANWVPNIFNFDAEGFGKDFAQGNLWLCQGYVEVIRGEVTPEQWENEVDFFIPENGGPSYLDSMGILKDSQNVELATQFINFIHRPENYAKFLDYFEFPCYVNMEAEKFMTTKPLYPASALENCELKYDLGDKLSDYWNAWEKIRIN